ncbi:hypothetical protein HY640_04580 [Candidatus Woesearchaeota archaeon]|nr:hypothetical protein [Candidatus Woesearchaeota archaeon]
MSKKGLGLPYEAIMKFVIGVVVVILIFAILGLGTKLAKGPIEAFKNWIGLGTEQEKCSQQKNHFWCEKAVLKEGKYIPGCVEWGKIGTEGESCDPRSYKPANYKKGAQDICSEECRVTYCPADQGRVDKKCVKGCRWEGEACGGALFWNKGECCAPEQVECTSSLFGTISGTCKKRATIKT